MAFLRTLEIVSLVTTVYGLVLLGEKVALGFIVFDISLFCQLIIFIKNKNYFLIFQMFVLMAFNAYNYIKWIGGV